MAFFYIAIGAIFVGYCNLLTSQGEFAFEKIILLIFGYAVSLFGIGHARVTIIG